MAAAALALKGELTAGREGKGAGAHGGSSGAAGWLGEALATTNGDGDLGDPRRKKMVLTVRQGARQRVAG